MRKFSFVTAACTLLLGGCSLVRDLVGKADTAMGPAPEIVVPSSLLEGRAARLQDSLKPRLDWLASHPPKGWSPVFIAFQNDSDSTQPVGLLIGTVERVRLNSHRRASREVAREEARRILLLQPWKQEASASKLPHPLSVQVVYRSRDYLVSSSAFQEDTVTIRYSDSSVVWKGAPLEL